jgi:hypothetical protein
VKLLLLFALVSALSLSTEVFADVAGTYTGGGTNPGGTDSYDCDVVITKTGEVYNVQWYFGGALGYEGVGITKNGLLCVGFANPEGYGVVVYDVKADGSLEGVWTGPGTEELGTETLTKK